MFRTAYSCLIGEGSFAIGHVLPGAAGDPKRRWNSLFLRAVTPGGYFSWRYGVSGAHVSGRCRQVGAKKTLGIKG